MKGDGTFDAFKTQLKELLAKCENLKKIEAVGK